MVFYGDSGNISQSLKAEARNGLVGFLQGELAHPEPEFSLGLSSYLILQPTLCDSNMEMKGLPKYNSGNRQPISIAVDIKHPAPLCKKLGVDLVVNKGQLDAYIQVLVNTSHGSN